MTEQPVTHETMTFERRIDVPLQRVWDAYADIDQRAIWSVPEGEAIEYESNNFEVGGVDEYRCGPPDDLANDVRTRYHHIDAPRSVVSSNEVRFHGGPTAVDISQWHLQPDGESTLVTIVVQVTSLVGDGMLDGYRNGHERALDHLEKFLGRRTPRADRRSRLIDAPVSRVFDALVDRAALETWLPPPGMTGRFEHFDPTPGGSYRLVLTYADPSAAAGKTTSNSDVMDVRFLDIVADDRVVQAVDFDTDAPEFAGTMTMTWSVSEEAGGTRVEVIAEGVPAGISAEDHAEGLASSLENLADHLES